MGQTKFIDGHDIKIEGFDENSLEVHLNGSGLKRGIRPRRLFTISNPYSYIQLVKRNGSEVGILKDISSLDDKSQKTLKEALDKFYVIPEIQEINDIYEEFGVSKWDVVTDRGKRTFEVQSRNTDIHLLGNGRVLIRDADNNRYEIKDYNKLPKESYKLLEGEI
ncbi:MAG: DUF1854 domain-containing protein [Clostridiales bacterium]|nr:DUF1854 domain-containing protein [Clostridiales bacterium]